MKAQDLAQRIASLPPEKQALLKLRLEKQKKEQVKTRSSDRDAARTLKIPKRTRSDTELERFPISFAQQRMWFQDSLGVNSAVANNLSASLKINGSLQVLALDRALKEILRRHAILRTTIQVIDGELMQVIAPRVDWTLPVIDLRSLTPNEQDERARSLIQEQGFQPIDLAKDWCWQFKLLQLGQKDHMLLATIHHIAVDGWSFGVFFRELSALYGAFAQGRPSPLPELPVQYVDFSLWQQEYFQGDTLAKELEYWRKTLQNAPDVLPLPSDRPRPTVISFQGKTLSFLLPKTLTNGLKRLSQQAGATLYTTLLAALQTLLFRYCGEEDIPIGSPIANRHQPEVEPLIGCFINTLVFRSDLSGNPSFRQLIERVKETVLDALAHQTLPFEKLVKELQPTRNVAYAPIFQVMLVLQNTFSVEEIELPGLNVAHSRIDNKTSQFDLTFHLVEDDNGLIGKLEYNTDLFDEPRMVRMLGHFQTLLDGIISNPDRTLEELPLLAETERQKLKAWQGSNLCESATACIHQLFEAQVKRTPEATAVVFGEKKLSYRELNTRANQLAHHLQSLGVRAEVPVGICLERSVETLVGLLGILKAGGAYVPMDPNYPQQRLEFMLQSARVRVLVTEEMLWRSDLEHSARAVYLDKDKDAISRSPSENLSVEVQARDLAYIIYTSGSTGQPKGVAIAHSNLVNAYFAWESAYQLRAKPISHLQMASFSFDVFTGDWVRTLCSGGKLVICPREVLLEADKLYALMRRNQVDYAEFVPAVIRYLMDYLEATAQNLEFMRVLIVGSDNWYLGEFERLRQFCGTQTRLINSYGVTEATIDSSYFETSEVNLPSGQLVPIGRSFANTQLYVLDARLQPVPIGIPGELYIGGAGLARGYLDRPDLTQRAFIPNPFDAGARLYKTGDRVCYREDGNLEFLGRIDKQIKIRGFRIELGEIETVLSQHPDVRICAVIPRDVDDDRQLVGYVVLEPDRAVTSLQLRRFLEKQLPKYAIPSIFIWPDELPLNAHGKVDRKGLPVPKAGASQATETFVPPKTLTEKTIAEIFAEILKLDRVASPQENRVGLYDDFFELGGHSLLAVKLLARLNCALDIELGLVDLFESSTVSGLATRVEDWREKPTAQSPLNLEEEVVLDSAIAPPEGYDFQWAESPKQIFLSGATGFLGGFLLVELLQKTSAIVHCLVRAADEASGRQRIQDNLESYQLWQERFRDSPGETLRERIVVIPGDLSKPYLGLSLDRFQELGDRVEVIYHNGAFVNSLYPYSAFKQSNVLGTEEILRLAVCGKLKAVHFVSSLSVVHSPAYLHREAVLETDGECPQGLFNGYAQSKWVAEQICQIARSRGIPVSIYRPGVISGHSQAGVGNTRDLLHTVLKGFVQLKSAPDLKAIWDFTPVDYVAGAIVHLSQQSDSIGNVFHLTNPQPILLSDLIEEIASFGYPLEKMAYKPWRKRLADFVKESGSNQWNSLLPIFPKDFLPEQLRVLTIKFDSKNTLQGLANTSITCPPVDRQLLGTYLSYLIDRGFLDSPARK
ncbi:amino acid adenylation domain-containing protein [Oscillatoriales cyanobacterium LEGE 11467]|uniref:Amino acid adenylation domain-containing protein n=1 Tax=Zarconia navalis LEGE 11467 TaxID=1828826 RepID=A0A928Z9D4_9CYAN|nr:non-ribosomal peptide synthetase [Zarconia navalis]MBE9040661.1 amino acid adenylation domain-containing protein [Zarconia navalis LEGE 11467]